MKKTVSGLQVHGLQRHGRTGRETRGRGVQIATLAACVGAASAWGDGVRLHVIALTGQPAPGMGPGAVFTSVGTPRLHASGDVAFWGSVIGDDVLPQNQEGLWIGGTGPSALVWRQGSPAPWYSEPTDFVAAPAAIFRGDGGLALIGATTAYNLPDLRAEAQNIGLFSFSPAAGVIAHARTGEQAPGLPPESPFLRLRPPTAGTGDAVFFTASGGAGLWMADDGATTPLVIVGDPIPGLMDEFGVLDAPAVNATGDIAFRTLLASSPLPTQHFAIVATEGPDMRVVIRTGDAAPGIDGATIDEPGMKPMLSDGGEVAFYATLEGPAPEADSAIWFGRPGSLSVVAREGDPTPGGPGVWGRLDTPTTNNAAQVAFAASIVGAGSSVRGVWHGAPGALTEAARIGTLVPDRADGAVFTSLERPVLDDQGQVVFGGIVQVGAGRHHGLFARDIAGRLITLARVGDMLTVAPGDERVIKEIAFETAGESGERITVNQARQVTLTLRFEDHTVAVVRGTIFNPADFTRDGGLSLDDLFSFLDEFVAESPRGDFNQDGVWAADDLSGFIDAFVRG